MKNRMIDLFAGCGGLTEGFLQTGKYCEIAAVEWLKPQVETLRNRLKYKWGEPNVDETVMHFDIQREFELFHGWSDVDYGVSKGLDYYVERAGGIDVIIGGPPCQAYSVAGRVRDENGMKNDYRNYLFEHYLSVVQRYKPKVFVFENVPGILSAMPSGVLVTDLIKKSFAGIGYEIIDDMHLAIVNAAEYGVPQNRNRMIIVGIRKIKGETQRLLSKFYREILPKYKSKKTVTVQEAIGDLPPCLPYYDEEHHKRHISHSTPICSVTWHIPRYNNMRDMDTFRILADDLSSGRCEFNSQRISELYEEKVGSKSPIHRYHVLNPNEPSTTILAHLYKDGNRFIHYDAMQCRTITVREAARIQSFPDDFDFIGNRGNAYQMIGNAVPPKLAKAVAESISELLEEI